MPSAWADQPLQVARLLTASATTGWFDWIHGELWLLPSGLLRIPSGLLETTLHGIGPTINLKQDQITGFDQHTFHSLIANPRNVWVPREQIRQAYLHRGIITDRLRLVLAEGRSVKFLWLPKDGAFQPLQAILQQWIGDDLLID